MMRRRRKFAAFFIDRGASLCDFAQAS